jgi:8-oxo-dGTP diphosphatase
MEAGGEQVRELMSDIRAVEWLPLEVALERLSRGYERVFLENVGPIAVSGLVRKMKEKAKRREAAVAAPQLPPVAPVSTPQLEPVPAEADVELVAAGAVSAAEPEMVLHPDDADPVVDSTLEADDGTMPPRHLRASFAERVRNWLGRAA